MNRRPVVGFVLNVARSARQLVKGASAFDDALAVDRSRIAAARAGGQRVGNAASSGFGAEPSGPLHLRDLSSTALWLKSCRRSLSALRAALGRRDLAEVEAHLAHFGGLLRLGDILSGLGVLGFPRLHAACRSRLFKAYDDVVRQGLDEGVVVPGATRGVSAARLLSIRVGSSASELLAREDEQRHKLDVAVQRCYAGSADLLLNDDDLEGLPENIKKQWASSLGSAAVWRTAKYKLRVGRHAMIRVMPYCQNPETRSRVFETYFRQFLSGSVHEAALDVLRTRQQLARLYGFNSWADYELRPLAVSNAAAAHQLMDKCWLDAQASLQPFMRAMEDLNVSSAASVVASSGSQAATVSGVKLSQVAHTDEAFFRALATRQMDLWKLGEYLPAESALGGLTETIGGAYNVRFVRVEREHLSAGWRPSVRAYEVRDGPYGVGRRLGYVYVELSPPRSLFHPQETLPPGALLVCPGHCFLHMHFSSASMGSTKLLNIDEATMLAHELGHAVHMLCHGGSTQDFDDQPLDLLELPSTLAETIALHPNVIAQYARHHASGGPPPDVLSRSCQLGSAYNLIRILQSAHVALGLHGGDFDAATATPDELRRVAVALWQRYSPVAAHPDFTPLGEDAGVYVSVGANHVAYLLCHLRADAILHSGIRKSHTAGGKAEGRIQDAAQRWLTPAFAGMLRSQLLDRDFPGQRLASLLPPLAAVRGSQAPPPAAHPLPIAAFDPAAMFARRFQRKAA